MKAGREMSIEEIVADLCRDIAPATGSAVSLDEPLSALGFDSLAVADLAVAVEERFAVRMADADLDALRTIRDVAANVRAGIAPGPRIPPGLGRLQQRARSVAGPVLAWFLRMQVVGAEHVPATGPVILASNHRSFWDIPVHVVATPRPVAFMAKRELYKGPVLRWLWRVLGGFPVRREIADLRAVDTALALLDRGHVVVVYPEGTRSPSEEMLPFLHGAAWLALCSGAAIVPCGLIGTERRRPGHPRRRRVRVVFGRPIPVDLEPDPRTRRGQAEAISGRLLAAITDLVSSDRPPRS